MESTSENNTISIQNFDLDTFLKGTEAIKQQESRKSKKDENTNLNFDLEAFLKGAEAIKQQKATQSLVSTKPTISTPEATTIPSSPAKKGLVERFLGKIKTEIKKNKIPKLVTSDLPKIDRRDFLKFGAVAAGTILSTAVMDTALAGGLLPKSEGTQSNMLFDVIGKNLQETGKQFLEGDFITDIFIPVLAKEAARRRTNNPEAEGIDPELAKDIDFSILIAGTGSELTDYGERNADANQLITFSKKHGIKIISIPRDIQSPEVYEASKKQALQKGEKAPETYESEIMRSLRVGGPDLLKKVVQHTTGAPVDFYMEIEHDAVPVIIDELFGSQGIEVNVPEDIKVDAYGREGFHKGPQMMKGKDVDVYVKTRTSSTMERRNSAQQEVIKIVTQEYFKRLKTNNLQDNKDMITKSIDMLDKLQKYGKLTIDLPIKDILMALATQLPKVSSNVVAHQISGTSFFNLPSIPQGLGFTEGGDLKRSLNGGPRMALMNPIDKITGITILPDLSHENTIQELDNYYRSLRQNSRKYLTAV